MDEVLVGTLIFKTSLEDPGYVDYSFPPLPGAYLCRPITGRLNYEQFAHLLKTLSCERSFMTPLETSMKKSVSASMDLPSLEPIRSVTSEPKQLSLDCLMEEKPTL
jgi:hypothetical protein